ncbi:MAG: amidohydrolase family protein [candidate division WOR-3 bacterium]
MKKTFIISLLVSLLYSNIQIPGEPQKGYLALVNGFIHTVTNGDIENGQILIKDGKIIDLGKEIKIPENSVIIDLKGNHVYPGFIDANSIIGLIEISSIEATLDYAEVLDFNPNVRAEVAINPDSELLPVTRANGILISNVVPQGGIITGSSSVIMLDGWTNEDMVLKSISGIHLKWPSKKEFSYRFYMRPKSEEELLKEYEEKVKKIKEFFEDAYSYLKAKYSDKKLSEVYDTDERFEAMVPLLKGEIPLFIHADEYYEVRDALDFFGNFKNLKLILVGGYDSWRLAYELKSKNIPVIITGIHTNPVREDEPYDEPFTLPYKLYKEGVKFCIAGSGSAFSASNARNLPYKVSTACAFGLPLEEGIKSITIYAAEILGISDRVGSIEKGKDATLIVTDGNPLDIKTNVLMAFIQGKKVDLESKHTLLFKKYLKKYKISGFISDTP